MDRDPQRQDEYVAREFDRAAEGYDDSRIVNSYQRRTQALVLGRMQIEKGMHVLDLGCGTGWATLEIAARLEGTGKAIGQDLSKKMIEQAEGKLAGFVHDNVEFILGSGSSLEYDGYFDYVLSTNAFHHFANKEDIFSRVRRSLKRDGVFLIQDICDDYLLMKMVDLAGKIGERAHVGSTTSQGLERLFLSAGFADVEVEKVKLNWLWGIMIGRGVKRGD